MLRRISQQIDGEREREYTKPQRRQSKRERFAHFFRSRKQKSELPDTASVRLPAPCRSSPQAPACKLTMPLCTQVTSATDKTASIQSPQDTATSNLHKGHPSSNSVGDATSSPAEAKTKLRAAPLEGRPEEKIETLSKEYINSLFAGAPSFSVTSSGGRPTPRATYPRNSEPGDVSDSLQPTQPAFLAATLHEIAPKEKNTETSNPYHGYEADVFEVPGWPGAHGIEKGSIGFAHFLELPHSDSLVTGDSLQSSTNHDSMEAARNRDMMQTNPERIGIRFVDMNLVYDRLIEFQDLYDAFRETPEKMTILNNQSPGDLYANLFSKFLTPPGYDGSTLDPTGLQVQILALLRILSLKGVWYDFSLVEWRIRLGQILFSDPLDPMVDRDLQSLWTERDKLMLQITLACELLLRLDAVVRMDARDPQSQPRIHTEELDAFLELKSRKTDWDLVLARRFLENILVVKGNDAGGTSTPVPESRGLFSMLGGSTPGGTPRELPKSDIILLPQHQARQLSALVHFGEAINWPNMDSILKEMATKLSIHDNAEKPSQPSSPSGWSFNPTTPSSISIYGTPLQTPRSANHLLDGYFGQIKQPVISRNNSRSLRIPLSNTLVSPDTTPGSASTNIGGWLSRSFLTGLILPGEAISHFLMSTLLENDKLAMTALGDSANLYGGFIYAGRTWWSKSSVVGRVLACMEGSTESMGWISLTKLPDGLTNGWHEIQSQQLPFEHPLRLTSDDDLVAQASAIIPDDIHGPIKPEELTLPSDKETVPTPTVKFTQWDLTPLNPDLIDDDDQDGPGPSTESDLFTPSLTFEEANQVTNHVLTLTYDVQFIASMPCTPPRSTSTRSLQHVSKRSIRSTLSHTSSKRSSSIPLSRRNSLGYEPLLSHPPEATEITPRPIHSATPEDEPTITVLKTKPVTSHPLHVSYKYSIVPATSILSPKFRLPFTMYASSLPARSSSTLLKDTKAEHGTVDNRKNVLVIDARDSTDLELLARAWCAEKGLHAIIGRVGRTCLACCIREARGVGVNIVIRV
jgi:hypothetical protein